MKLGGKFIESISSINQLFYIHFYQKEEIKTGNIQEIWEKYGKIILNISSNNHEKVKFYFSLGNKIFLNSLFSAAARGCIGKESPGLFSERKTVSKTYRSGENLLQK